MSYSHPFLCRHFRDSLHSRVMLLFADCKPPRFSDSVGERHLTGPTTSRKSGPKFLWPLPDPRGGPNRLGMIRSFVTPRHPAEAPEVSCVGQRLPIIRALHCPAQCCRQNNDDCVLPLHHSRGLRVRNATPEYGGWGPTLFAEFLPAMHWNSLRRASQPLTICCNV
jgi:hypothetical protein